MNENIPPAMLWFLSCILFFLFSVLATVNAVYLIGQIRSRFEYGPSLMPFFGGIFGLIAILILPVGHLSDRLFWCWLPLVFDAGSFPFVVLGLYYSKK